MSGRRLRSAVLRLVGKKPAPRPGIWGPLAEPVYPGDTHARMRAQSILAGETFREPTDAPGIYTTTQNPGVLTITQARDVIAWAANWKIR